MPVTGPTVVRRQLGRRLQRMREDASRKVEEVEDARIVSRATLWRIERGKVPVKIPVVQALSRFYGASEAEADALEKLAIGTSEQGWWEEYADVVPEWFQLYVGLEAAAARIQTWEDCVIPGELQTADYARAVFRAAQPDDGEEAIKRYIALRLERQEGLFGRTPPPALAVVLGENVLTRPVGGSDVLAAQLQHLRELDQRAHVEIRVLPYNVGAHAAMTGAFRILDFDDAEDPDLVYLETQVGARYLEKPGELEEYRRIWELICKQAVPIGEYRP